MNGYAGKILRVNLTEMSISEIETSKYADDWIGGHGMGSAIFYDILVNEYGVDLSNISGFDPENVLTLMTSPLCGTLVPGGSARTEIQGIGIQSSPEWFTRSNFGGRFAPMLKFAGWDGIVIEGSTEDPVWIDIRDNHVQIRDCETLSLWGTDTWDCQQKIWKEVAGSSNYDEWIKPSDKNTGMTTQRPAVLAIGQAGENKGRIACLVHDAGNAAGQGGFGGVWGAKNLKAISVIGTGSISVNDPKALLQARLWAQQNYRGDLGKLSYSPFGGNSSKPANVRWREDLWEPARLSACIGCHIGCKTISNTGFGNESTCYETVFALEAISFFNKNSSHKAADLLQQYGINAYEALLGYRYICKLNERGIIGPGKQIDCDLDFGKLKTLDFVNEFLEMMAFQKGDVGKAMSEGFYRAAEIWGTKEEDLETGDLEYPYWGLPEHTYDPRAEIEWGYGSILGDRDINEHCFNYFFWSSNFLGPYVENAVKIVSSKLIPYENNTAMLDYSTNNMYSEDIAKLVVWHRHYTRFWKQSVLLCDNRWPDFINTLTEDVNGLTPEGEIKFFKAVTGRDITFKESMEIGKKIWNLDNAIWVLQGRHRDDVHFSEYIYKEDFKGKFPFNDFKMPCINDDGEWEFMKVNGRHLDRGKFEEFKTRFYILEGWDTSSGYPTRTILESVGLDEVADELDSRNKLGVSAEVASV